MRESRLAFLKLGLAERDVCFCTHGAVFVSEVSLSACHQIRRLRGRRSVGGGGRKCKGPKAVETPYSHKVTRLLALNFHPKWPTSANCKDTSNLG